MWRIVFAIKVIVTLGLVAWLVSRIDLVNLWSKFSLGNPVLLLAGTAILAFQPLLGAIRWHLILQRLGLSLVPRDILRWTYAGVFVNQVLPATVGGDGLRIWLASRAGGELARVINSVVLDRVVMVLCLAVLVVASAPWFGQLIPSRQLVVLSFLLFFVAVGGFVFMMFADAMPDSLERLRLGRWVANLSMDTRKLILDWRSGPGIVGLSLLSSVNLMVSLCFFTLAFGSHATWSQIIVLLAPVIAASTLPISIGGWGTREIALVAVLGSIGIPAETAVLASVWLGLASAMTSLPGAFFYLYRTAPPIPQSSPLGGRPEA